MIQRSRASLVVTGREELSVRNVYGTGKRRLPVSNRGFLGRESGEHLLDLRSTALS